MSALIKTNTFLDTLFYRLIAVFLCLQFVRGAAMFEFSTKSLKNLDGVHPDLKRVALRAIKISSIDFGITDGVRTQSKQLELMAEGKSFREDSNHLIQDSGYGHAIDVVAWFNGKITWHNKYYGPIVQAFTSAAIEEGTQLAFGHLWPNFQDSVHIELDEKYY